MTKKSFSPTEARAAGRYDPDPLSLGTGTANSDPSLTDQSQAVEADINTIVQRFKLTGEIPVSQRTPFPMDVDFDEIFDYQEAQHAILRARASFASLPAEVRTTFQNDALAFADFASDPKNLEKLQGWGLAPPSPPKPSPAV